MKRDYLIAYKYTQDGNVYDGRALVTVKGILGITNKDIINLEKELKETNECEQVMIVNIIRLSRYKGSRVA